MSAIYGKIHPQPRTRGLGKNLFVLTCNYAKLKASFLTITKDIKILKHKRNNKMCRIKIWANCSVASASLQTPDSLHRHVSIHDGDENHTNEVFLFWGSLDHHSRSWVYWNP